MSKSSNQAQKIRQREHRRAKRKEEPLGRKNAYGQSDPTPRLAVEHIREKELRAIKREIEAEKKGGDMIA